MPDITGWWWGESPLGIVVCIEVRVNETNTLYFYHEGYIRYLTGLGERWREYNWVRAILPF
jgi:hypothetical protein